MDPGQMDEVAQKIAEELNGEDFSLADEAETLARAWEIAQALENDGLIQDPDPDA